MHPLIENKRDAIAQLCRLHGVRSLEALFGRSVDLVEPRAIRNRRLKYYIEQSKTPVYAAT